MKDHKVLKVFVIVLVSLFFAHQLYSSAYKPITTVSAEYAKVTDGIKAQGTVVRSESYITSQSGGVLHFLVPDGEHVAKGGVIANAYENASVSSSVSRYEEVCALLTDIEALSKYNSVNAADLSVADARVNDNLSAVIKSSRGGKIFESIEKSDALLSAINRRLMITGEETDFSARANDLANEKAQLEASLPAASYTVTAPMSGFFLSGTDGFENIFSSEKLSELTPERLSNATSENPPEGTIGKIVSDYEWYIACIVSMNDSLKYKVGDRLTLVTTQSDGDLPVTLETINNSENSDRATLVFSCNSLSRQLAAMRSGTFTIVNKSYEGLKLPKKSLHVVKGKTGIYVLSGINLKFVTVDVLYSMDDDIICKQEKSNGKVLRLYDEVVLKGKNLYDGKIVG